MSADNTNIFWFKFMDKKNPNTTYGRGVIRQEIISKSLVETIHFTTIDNKGIFSSVSTYFISTMEKARKYVLFFIKSQNFQRTNEYDDLNDDKLFLNKLKLLRQNYKIKINHNGDNINQPSTINSTPPIIPEKNKWLVDVLSKYTGDGTFIYDIIDELKNENGRDYAYLPLKAVQIISHIYAKIDSGNNNPKSPEYLKSFNEYWTHFPHIKESDRIYVSNFPGRVI